MSEVSHETMELLARALEADGHHKAVEVVGVANGSEYPSDRDAELVLSMVQHVDPAARLLAETFIGNRTQRRNARRLYVRMCRMADDELDRATRKLEKATVRSGHRARQSARGRIGGSPDAA